MTEHQQPSTERDTPTPSTRVTDLSLGPRPATSRSPWKTTEIKILRDHYPTGGAKACAPLLPGRSPLAIYYQAQRIGIKTLHGLGNRVVYRTTPQIDNMIRTLYQAPPKPGAVKALSERIDRPRWWLRQRAIRLGISVPRFKETAWSAEEVRLVEANAHKKPNTITRLLARHGYSRSASAVMNKIRRLQCDTTDYDHYSARGLSIAMGVDAKTVTRWIQSGLLKADRKGTDRTDQQGGDMWRISRKQVREFIADNVGMIDIRKVDKYWLVDLLVGKYE